VGEGYVHVRRENGKWGCPDCRWRLVAKWTNIINTHLPGSVLYAEETTLQGQNLSSMIRRKLKKRKYCCAHLVDGAILFSNVRFIGSTARNKKSFLKKINSMMETGQVCRMSRDKKRTKEKENTENTGLWSLACLLNKDLLPEYQKCKNDFEIGLFLLKYIETPDTISPTTRGEYLLCKIRKDQINAAKPNLCSTLKAIRRKYLKQIDELVKILKNQIDKVSVGQEPTRGLRPP
jgi:hypothetical protein